MKLGIGSYALAWSVGVSGYEAPAGPLSAFDLLSLVREYGLKLVQYADNLPLIGLTREERAQLARQASESGIEIEAGTRGTDPEHLLEYLSICREMNVRLLRTLITASDLEQARMELEQVLPDFEKHGVILGIENHGLHTAKQLSDLLNRIQSPCLGCVLDTVNSFGALEGPEQVVNVLAPHTVNLHLKDFVIRRVDHQMGYVITGAPAGAGRLNIPDLLDKVAANGRRVTVVLELWPPFEESVERTVRIERLWLEESLRYLMPLFQHG